jgi:uncharacterized protein DUF5996
VEIEFDFCRHELAITTTGGTIRRMPLVPRTVADFYDEFRSHLHSLGIDVAISAAPNEISGAIPFGSDEVHDQYDAAAVHRFWRSLVDAHRVMSRFRAGFRGKASPVHFFWGPSTWRSPGSPAGLRRATLVAFPTARTGSSEASSDEVSGCGYWPGGPAEGVFCSCAYPSPAGFAGQPVSPEAAYFGQQLGEFVLPYAAVRTASDPDGRLLEFLSSAFQAAPPRQMA